MIFTKAATGAMATPITTTVTHNAVTPLNKNIVATVETPCSGQESPGTASKTGATHVTTKKSNHDKVEEWENAMETDDAMTTETNHLTPDETTTQTRESNKDENEIMSTGLVNFVNKSRKTLNQVRSNKLTRMQEWTQVKGKRHHTAVYNTESKDTRVNTTAKDIMKQRGEVAVETTTTRDTPVQVEFKVSNATKSFNLRDAMG